MSSNLPPSGPPTPPSGPPSGPPSQGEVLEHGAGQPVARASSGSGGGSALRRGLFIGGGVVGAAAIGVGAWAAYSFIATGPQPAEALPAGTLAYLSVDLDPSGGQKIEALRTLNKFPAFKDEVGIDTDDDIKKSLFDKILEEEPCDGLTYDDDIEPWLGDRAAIAAVDRGEDTPDPVFVVQVKDADAADEGLDKIRACGTEGDGESESPGNGEDVGGWVIEGDWAVIAESEDIAREVADEAAEGSLADDEDFQRLTDEAGDAGVVTMYAAPSLGDYLADNADSLFGGFPFGLGSTVQAAGMECTVSTDGSEECVETFPSGDSGPDETPEIPEGFEDYLRDFGGVAGTIRFDDGAIELEFAGASEQATPFFSEGGANDVISTLPEDTAAAFGVGFADDWFTDLLDFYAPLMGTEDVDELLQQMSEETGLDLPEDIETLLGDAAALSLDSDIDPEALVNSTDPSEVPVAVKVKGDPDEIEAVLEKLRAQAPPEDVLVLDSDSEGDFVVIGPNEDYRSEVLEDGNLGDNEVFQDVVREADDASAVVFVNIDELEDVIEEAAQGDQELIDNVKPLSGFGISGWLDGDIAHSVVRITTND